MNNLEGEKRKKIEFTEKLLLCLFTFSLSQGDRKRFQEEAEGATEVSLSRVPPGKITNVLLPNPAANTTIQTSIHHRQRVHFVRTVEREIDLTNDAIRNLKNPQRIPTRVPDYETALDNIMEGDSMSGRALYTHITRTSID